MVNLRSRLVSSSPTPGIEREEALVAAPRVAVVGTTAAAVVVADQCRPIDPEIAAAVVGAKRKPENRFLAASIRKAKTAMFRMTTSPMITSSSTMSLSSPSNNISRMGMRSWSVGEIYSNIGECPHSHGGSKAMKTGHCTTPTILFTTTMTTTTPTAASTTNLHRSMTLPSPRTVALEMKNVLEWLDDDAPSELLPRILSFCGSRKLHALSRVNKRWNLVMKDESVWQTLCEDTHKWSDGDAHPTSWAQYYKLNPVVPIDYDSIDAAFESISSGPESESTENRVAQQFREQRKSARVLVHPGPYFLRRPIVVNVIGSASVTIEAIEGVKDPEHGITWQKNYHGPSIRRVNMGMLSPRETVSDEVHRHSSPSFRQLFGCGRRSSSSAVDLDGSNSSASSSENDYDDGDQLEHHAVFLRLCFQGRPRALLCLESGRENEPVIRVRQGTVNIRGLKIFHYCEGTDIWNGNAAVQVQSAFGQNGRPLRVEPPSITPTANLSDCDIMSLSGRGVVVIDGAISSIHNCNVHTCAATGIYVGGSGSLANMTETDVIENGTGNTRTAMHSNARRRGVARGHSGVYVENGLASLRDCNISGNTLTGISAISTDEARLHIEDSDIRANRSDQMELPSPRSGRSINRNNTIASVGLGRPRSRHLMESVALESPRGTREAPLPQSPL